MSQGLIQLLGELLSRTGGPVGFFGPAHVGVELAEAGAGALIFDGHSGRRKVARLAGGVPLVRADAIFPPLAEQCLGSLVAAGELARQPDAARAVAAWAAFLKPGGALLVAELGAAQPILGGLRRLVRSGPPFRPPERISALLLNAGLARVGQQEAPGRPRIIVTVGYKRPQRVATTVATTR